MRKDWQRDELLLVFHIYCRTPFGKLHKSNPEIIELAEVVGRTPSAVAMKACNFANLDPALERKGLSAVSKADRLLWNEFREDSNKIALAAEDLFEKRIEPVAKENEVEESSGPVGETESIQNVKVRRVQRFFRNSVIVSYENRCAISGIQLPHLLIASHIIPWKDSIERRADPSNGISLNGLYDKAFDKGYITFDEQWRVCLSSDLKAHFDDSEMSEKLLNIEGVQLSMPTRFLPDPEAMSYHREKIFEKAYRTSS